MKPFNRRQWIDLMKRINDLNIQPMEETYNTAVNVVNIRHDVDDDIRSSVDMADMESDLGLRTTYFILDTAPYWLRPDTDDNIAEIDSHGHFVGWHNNAISNHIRTGKPLRQCIENPLNSLRLICPVIGTASHGDTLCHDMGYLNYYAFGFPVHANYPCNQFDKFKLEQFGLKYEAYFLGHTHYLSDAGGAWNHDPETYISDFENNGKKLIINIHPQWWNL